jgi:hypothetical protein
VFERSRNPSEDFKIKKLRYLIANHFMETYEIEKLPESDEVVGKSKLVSVRVGETHMSCNHDMNKRHI